MTAGAPLSRRWRWFLLLAVIAGAVLRLSFAADMEYKEDEEYNFNQSQLTDYAWLGMPSGVYIPNPGMSVWVFKWLARVAHATQPMELAHAVQLFALAGLCLLIPFAQRCLRPGEDRTPWLWACAIALVDPFAVFYQRKLWPEPMLPVFSMLMLMGWWRREKWLGAFTWGFVGAWLGQIHMSGFFYAFAFFLVTLLLPAREPERRQVRWGAWFTGSVLGALPLIPWTLAVLRNPVHETITRGWDEIVQFKFWVFWATDPLGLHLGNPLGLLRGPSNWNQISDFVRYPLVDGHASYLNLIAHLLAAGAAAFIILPGLVRALGRLGRGLRSPAGLMVARPNLQMALIAGVWGFGLLLTASSVMIRRYYLMVSFPLEFVWLTRLALEEGPRREWGARALGLLWGAQLFISACFVGYVHVNNGSTAGDYGEAYHVIRDRAASAAAAKSTGNAPGAAIPPDGP